MVTINIDRLNVLAVGDPAVYVYTDKDNNFIKKFEHENEIDINFDIVQWNDYYDTLLNSFRDYKYDIVMIAGHLWLREFVSRGYLLKLSGNFTKEYDYEDIMPVVRKEIEFGGHKYLLPSFCDGHILLYRKSQIRENPDDIISTDQIIEIVKNNASNQENTFVLKAHPSEIFLDFLPYLRSEGVEPFVENGRPLFNIPAAYNALEKYIEMKNYCAQDVAEYGNDEVREALQSKKCKLGVSWGGQLGQIMNDDCLEPEDIGFAALTTSFNTTWSFALNHLCRNRELAEEFMLYITSREVDKEVGVYCGNPTRKSSFKSGEDSYRWYPILQKMMEIARPLPHLPNTGQLINIVSGEIVKAFTKEKSAREAMEQAYYKIMGR